MILIISESTDISTLEVIRWLKHFKVPYCRINKTDAVTLYELDPKRDSFILRVDQYKIDLAEIDAIWYRRGKLNFSIFSGDKNIDKTQDNESRALNNFFFIKVLKNNNGISNYLTSSPNKLVTLEIALECGLKIPDTVISSDKKRVTNFIDIHQKVVTKMIDTHIRYRKYNKIYMGYTEEIDKEEIRTFNINFFPSLVQQKIDKKFEVRSFFLNGKFYSMAIFSQSNKATQTDFRKYCKELPNRYVPFKLPNEIRKKLLKFMKLMKLNSGSIDLIVDTEGEFVFLEVNPIGQFGFVSYPCNYYLERVVAQELNRYGKKKRA